jgi:hypothetical protein
MIEVRLAAVIAVSGWGFAVEQFLGSPDKHIAPDLGV